MMKILLLLLAAWLVVTVLGVVIEGLFWLAVVGIVLFLGTAGYAALQRRTGREVT
ncbi:MAG TPA: hypothetical protein VEZ42_20380 [Pseudonocardia sp.]|nr:hypothetical protein [Pseudonocardia sp.]